MQRKVSMVYSLCTKMLTLQCNFSNGGGSLCHVVVYILNFLTCDMETLKCNFGIGSLNARGLGQTGKREDVFSWLKNKKLSIYCISDFHCTNALHDQYIKEWGSNIILCEGKSDSRGVAILFSKDLDYELFDTQVDCDGNFVILDLKVYDCRFTLVAIYGPNKDKPSFFHEICNKVQAIQNSSIIICGDWNVVLDYEIDTKGYLHQNNPRAREAVMQMMESLELYDVWRDQNENQKKYTWVRNKRQMARLDYFLITSDWITRTSKTDISPGYRSDHSLITIKCNIGNVDRGRGFLKFNSSLLHEKEYVDLVKGVIEDTVEKYSITSSVSGEENTQFNVNDQMLFEMLKLEIRAKTISYSSHRKKKLEKEEKQLEQDIELLYEQLYEVDIDMSDCMEKIDEKKCKLERL